VKPVDKPLLERHVPEEEVVEQVLDIYKVVRPEVRVL
jgi:hypothetical protein